MSRGPRVEYWLSANGRWYFHRVAANGEVTDSSQGYASVSGCRRAFRHRWPGIAEHRI